MKSVMRYVSQLSKTLWDGQPLVSGIGCQPETAFDEFLSTKLLHHKDGGVMFYHMVQSFPKGANIDPRTAHEAARRLAGYFDGCEVLVCTHVDREHIHSHCIINSVNFETGRKVHMADEQIQELRIRNDQICEELGLPKFQKDEQRQPVFFQQPRRLLPQLRKPSPAHGSHTCRSGAMANVCSR